MFALPDQDAVQSSIINQTEASMTNKNCRYGVATVKADDTPFLDQLNAGWMLTFNVSFGREVPAGMNYTPMIRLEQERDVNGARLDSYNVKGPKLTEDGLGRLVDANPGLLWLVGNEVDRVFWQDDLMPDVYADAYHDIYHFIKARDPSARIAISGLVQVTPNRLEYLDLVWEAYQQEYGRSMPVDVWNMHLYILPELRLDGESSSASVAVGTDCWFRTDCTDIKYDSGGDSSLCALEDVYCYAEHDDMTIFAQQVRMMRQWMKDKGLQNKPLVISEYSLLYTYLQNPDGSCEFLKDENGNCFTPERVTQFMINSFNYLETATDPNLGYPLDGNRLVQQWLWFAMNDGLEGSPNKLVNDAYTNLTLMGRTFRDEVAARPLTQNLTVEASLPDVVESGESATIGVRVRNNGNTATTTPVTVTFYRNAARTLEIGSVMLPAGLHGCTVFDYEAEISWDGLADGAHSYWFTVDAGNAIVEADEADNNGSGLVLVNPNHIMLPFIR